MRSADEEDTPDSRAPTLANRPAVTQRERALNNNIILKSKKASKANQAITIPSHYNLIISLL